MAKFKSPEFLLFCGSFLVYLATASRGVTHGDTGEFLAVAAVGGVPHEPGYPLYSLLSRLAFLLPLGHPAWQVNALSGLFAALTVVIVYKTIRLLTQNSPAAWFAALSLATYNSFWYYSLVAEVHTLHILLMALLYYFLTSALKTAQPKYFYPAAAVFGLGLANNFTIIFALPGFAFTLFCLRQQLTLKSLVKICFISAFGLLFYLYTAITASLHPPLNWGAVHDVASFLHIFFRRDFGSVFLGNPEPPAPFRFHSVVYLFTSFFTTSWYLLPLIVLGLIYLKKHQSLFIVFILGFLFFGPLYYSLINTPVRSVVHQANLEQYIAYPFYFLSLFSGLGVYYLYRLFSPKKTFLSALFIFIFFIFPFFTTFISVRQDTNVLVDQTSRFLLSGLPPNTVLLAWSDSLYFPGIYQQYVNHVRPDVSMIQLGLLNIPWYQSELLTAHPDFAKYIVNNHLNYHQICQDLAPENRLYFYPWYQEFATAFAPDCTLIPQGLVIKIVPTSQVPPIENLIASNSATWQNYVTQIHPQNYQSASVRTQESLFYLSEFLNYAGIYYQQAGRLPAALSTYTLASQVSAYQTNALLNSSAIYYNQGDYASAINILKTGISRNPSNSGLYKNLGLTYLKINNPQNAAANLKLYLEFPSNDPDRPNLTRFVNSSKLP